MILSTLYKLGHVYKIFVYVFYTTTNPLGNAHKLPSLDGLLSQLTKEQEMLAQMGTLMPPRSQELIAKDLHLKASSDKDKKHHKNSKYNERTKDHPLYPTPKFKNSSQEESSKKKKIKYAC